MTNPSRRRKTPSLRSRPSKVPVASRDRENAERAARRKQRGRAIAFPKQDMASVVILIAVLILVLLAIAAPLRNFYEGRAEIARANESIARLEAQKQALEEGTDVWDSPDAAVNQPAQDVPVATAQPSPAPSAAGSASSSLQQGAGQSGSASGGTGGSAASSAQQGTLPHAGWNGKVSQAFSGNTLVYNPTLGDWRTHNGTDYTAEQVTAVAAGTVTAIADDALWGRVVEVTDAQDRVWRYGGLEEVAVTQREKVTAGTRLGTTGNVPAEAQQGSHLHLECRKAGACLDPEKN